MIKEINIKLKNDVLKFDKINLSNLNFLSEPKFICIAGENGSGKTTLFNFFKSTLNVSDVQLTKSNTIFISHIDVNAKLSQEAVNSNNTLIKNILDNVIHLPNESEAGIDGSYIKWDELTGNTIIKIMNEIINLQRKIILSEDNKIIDLETKYSKENFMMNWRKIIWILI